MMLESKNEQVKVEKEKLIRHKVLAFFIALVITVIISSAVWAQGIGKTPTPSSKPETKLVEGKVEVSNFLEKEAK